MYTITAAHNNRWTNLIKITNPLNAISTKLSKLKKKNLYFEPPTVTFSLISYLPELDWQLDSFFSQSASDDAVPALLMQILSQGCPTRQYTIYHHVGSFFNKYTQSRAKVLWRCHATWLLQVTHLWQYKAQQQCPFMVKQKTHTEETTSVVLPVTTHPNHCLGLSYAMFLQL